jgi:diguanylate cyclase (GGDEF)-like protein
MRVLRDAGDAAPEGGPTPLPIRPPLTRVDTLVDSYRRLADVFHELLSEEGLESLLERIADALADLIPYDTFTIYQADETRRLIFPVMARDTWAEEIMKDSFHFGEGITGWAVEQREAVLVNDAHLDPRVQTVPGTPEDEPEAMISVALVARGATKGALNIYRLGKEAFFSEEEFELAKRFADAAALGLDNAQARAALELQAQTDSLTGLYNHRFFHERLRAELNRANRTHEQLAVLMLDIDDFKRVNDVHGHGAGDQVLVALAEILRTTVRASDVVCRLGGEEFGIIMGPADSERAVAFARRLAERLEAEELDPAGTLTLSIGVSEGPRQAANPRELIAFAEAAMMTAKARGKNGTVLFGEETTERPAVETSPRDDVRSIAHLKMLQSLAGKLNRLNDVAEIGATIVNELRMLVDYHSCRVYVAEGAELVPIAWRGDHGPYSDESAEELQSKFGEGITGRAAESGESLLLANALDCDYAVTIPGTDDIEESMIAVPLKYGSRVIGVVVISKLGIGQFDQDDVRLLEVLGGQASVALENARLYEAQRAEAESAKASLERLEETFLSTIEALANALEANDEYTSSHARAITDMALLVGRKLGLDAKTLKRLELGALFHDIGKIGIPTSILLKPGPLSEEERAVMETHPEVGERILAPIARLEDVRPVVRHCHERWDGAGYPDGWRAEDIPIESRVILVCDAFHAMTTDRPYRARLTVEEAVRRLKEAAGTQFDPAVVRAFLDLESRGLVPH